MNWSIYQSFARIPLGLAVTIEFIGPAHPRRGRARGGRATCSGSRWRGSGSALLGFEPTELDLGRASRFALLAAALWAAYILLSAQTGRRWPGLDGLALASVVATLPADAVRDRAWAASDLLEPQILLLGRGWSGC